MRFSLFKCAFGVVSGFGVLGKFMIRRTRYGLELAFVSLSILVSSSNFVPLFSVWLMRKCRKVMEKKIKLLSSTQLNQVVVVGPVEWTIYILIPEGLPLRIQS